MEDYITEFPENFLAGLELISDKIMDIGEGIVDWIIDGLSGLAGALWDAITGALPDPGDIMDKITGGSRRHRRCDRQRVRAFGAEGGVFNQATPMIIGEAGTEALIPITRPARALALMQQSGLDKMVLDAYLARRRQSAPSPASTMRRRDDDAAHRQRVMTAPVDADMVVQKVTSAYNRLRLMSYPPEWPEPGKCTSGCSTNGSAARPGLRTRLRRHRLRPRLPRDPRGQGEQLARPRHVRRDPLLRARAVSLDVT